MEHIDDVFEILPYALVFLNPNLYIFKANKKATILFGRTAGELEGSFFIDYLSESSRSACVAKFDAWQKNVALSTVKEMPEKELFIRLANGKEMKVFLSFIYKRIDGNLSYILGSLRPQIRGANSESGIEIVATVSHELRSPLTSIKGYSTLLLARWDRLRDDQKQMMLQQINHDADRVTRLITELLDITRLQLGRLVLHKRMVDIELLVVTTVEKLQFEHPELEVSLSFPDEFPTIYSDPDKLVQIITNLIENASKYASPKGIVISGEVLINEVQISVKDQGMGIPKQDLPKVFNKFFHHSDGKPSGSGLGLWISRGLVEAHGGKLTVVSELNIGSIFSFTLPVTYIGELDE